MGYILKLLHLPNKPNPLAQDELFAYRDGGFVGAKLLKEHTPDHIGQLESVRPGGLYFGRLAEPTRDDGSLPSYEDVSHGWFDQIKLFEPMGVYDWQCGVEPNNVCKVTDAQDWRWLVSTSIKYTRSLLIDYWRGQGYGTDAIRYRLSRLRFWLAPLADGPGHWHDIEMPKGWWDEYEIILREPGIIFGYCVDSYWQYTKYSLQDGFGANIVRHRKRFEPVRPGMWYFVAEWGCSRIDTYIKPIRDNPPPDVVATCQQTMMESYRPWLEWHKTNASTFCMATCLFIGRHSDGWVGFEPGDQVLASIKDA